MIPVFKSKMNINKILDELRLILDSGWIGLGPKTSEFEEKFAEIGLVQLESLEEDNKIRRELCMKYQSGLEGLA
jgi:dTDP-4-amino-4,6-dideoxygalactose transaminase